MNSQKQPVETPKSDRPEWVRPKDVQKFFGIGRSKTYELIAENKIKTVSLRARGAKHGTRLVSYDSISAYLESLATPAK